jgi:hypothetical protein
MMPIIQSHQEKEKSCSDADADSHSVCQYKTKKKASAAAAADAGFIEVISSPSSPVGGLALAACLYIVVVLHSVITILPRRWNWKEREKSRC